MSDTEKKPEAVAAATTDDKKKRKTAKVDSYATYIYKVLKQVHPDRGISKKGKPANPTLSSLISIAYVFDVDVRELLVVEYDSSERNAAEPSPAKHEEELPPTRP